MDQNKKLLKAEIKKQKKEKNWDAMLVTAQQALAQYPDVSAFKRAALVARSHYVDEKLSSSVVHDLEAKGAYDELMQIYSRLLMVFPESKKVKKRMEWARSHAGSQTLKLQNEALEEALTKARVFRQEGRLDEAIQASYEILAAIPDEKRALALNASLLKSRDRLINKEILDVFKRSHELVKQEYLSNKDAVLKL